MWTVKQFENNNVDEEYFIRFRNESAVFKFIPLSMYVALKQNANSVTNFYKPTSLFTAIATFEIGL